MCVSAAPPGSRSACSRSPSPAASVTCCPRSRITPSITSRPARWSRRISRRTWRTSRRCARSASPTIIRLGRSFRIAPRSAAATCGRSRARTPNSPILTDQPLRSGALVLDDGRQLPLIAGAANTYRVTVPLDKDGAYHLTMVDGAASDRGSPRTISSRPARPARRRSPSSGPAVTTAPVRSKKSPSTRRPRMISDCASSPCIIPSTAERSSRSTCCRTRAPGRRAAAPSSAWRA